MTAVFVDFGENSHQTPSALNVSDGRIQRSLSLDLLIDPSSSHVYRSLPALKHGIAFLGWYLRMELNSVFPIELFELVEIFPDADSEAGRNGSPQGCCLPHDRSVNRDSQDIRLRLDPSFSIHDLSSRQIQTCMQRSDALMPPSTAIM